MMRVMCAHISFNFQSHSMISLEPTSLLIHPSIAEASLRLLLATILGSMVGLEREMSRHPAGLRTHILVCLGSAVFTLLSLDSLLSPETLEQLGAGVSAGSETIRVVRDPARIAAQVVTGIGFIGGGVVLRHGATVRGLTTAASLWIVSSIGMLAGSGHIALSLMATLLTVLVLYGLGKFGRSLNRKHQKSYNRLKLTLTMQAESMLAVQTWVDDHFRGHVLEVKTQPRPNGKLAMVYVIDVTRREVMVNTLLRQLDAIDGIEDSMLKLHYTSLHSE